MSCLRPILIKNPNYGYFGSSNVARSMQIVEGKKHVAYRTLYSVNGRYGVDTQYRVDPFSHNVVRNGSLADRIQSFKDCSSAYIEVPCNSCVACARTRQNYLSQRLYLQGLVTDVYMCTLTCMDKYLRYFPCEFTGDLDKSLEHINVSQYNTYEYGKLHTQQLPDMPEEVVNDFDDMPDFTALPSIKADRREGYRYDRYLSYSISHADWSALTASERNGYVAFLPYSYIQGFLKRLRVHNVFGAPFSYSLCYEYGGKRHRPHYHILFFVKSRPSVGASCREYSYQRKQFAASIARSVWREWSINTGTRKHPRYEQFSLFITRDGRSPFDFHYVDPYTTPNGGVSYKYDTSVFFYVSKYLFKHDDYFNRLSMRVKYHSNADYALFRLLCRPYVRSSRFLGCNENTDEYIQKCVQYSLHNNVDKRPYMVFVLSDGSTAPLSPYWNRYISITDSLQFKELYNLPTDEFSCDRPSVASNETIKQQKYRLMKQMSDENRIYGQIALNNNYYE